MKFFWPIYVTSWVVGTAGIYVAAPYARPYVAGFFAPVSSEPAAEAADSEEQEQVRTGMNTQGQTQPEDAPATNDEVLPALQGVYPVFRGDPPGWGITFHRSTYYKPDGVCVGNVSGGVLFDFRATRKTSRGVMIEGLFFQNGVTNGPYLVSRKDVHLFTGSHTKLSIRQRDAVLGYYALSGKIELRKFELLQASAAKNPHFSAYKDAYQVLTAHIEKAKEMMEQRDKATEVDKVRLEDQLREMKMVEARLKTEFEAQHLKFRTWKDQHASEFAKPENDPDVKRWTQEMSVQRDIVPGLAL
jgi:hypothetical protein